MISIRRGTTDDVPLILELIRDLAEYEKLRHEVTATEDQLRVALAGDHPAAEVIIAESDGNAAGYALFFHTFSTFHCRQSLYLEDLFVRPAYRGLGIGKRLLSHLAGITVERKCVRFEWAVLDWNTPAIGFYQSLGAVPMDDWTVFRVAGDALDRLALAAG